MERRIFGFSLTQEATHLTAAQGQTLWNQHYLLFYFAVKKNCDEYSILRLKGTLEGLCAGEK